MTDTTSVGEKQLADGGVNNGVGSTTTIQDLDEQCLYQVMCRLDNILECPQTSELLDRFREHSVYISSPPCNGVKSLQACSLVCREWLKVSNLARSCLRLQGAAQVATLPRFLSRFPDLRHIQLMDMSAASPGDRGALPAVPMFNLPLGLLSFSCRDRLLSLTLVRCKATSDVGLAAVLRECSWLRTVHLDHYGGLSSGDAFLGVKCGLERLYIQFCSKLTSAGLTALERARGYGDVTVRRIPEYGLSRDRSGSLAAGLERVASVCPRLSMLVIEGCDITDATLLSFGVCCPQLRDVAFMKEYGITDAGGERFQLALRRLELLTLACCIKLKQIPRSR